VPHRPAKFQSVSRRWIATAPASQHRSSPGAGYRAFSHEQQGSLARCALVKHRSASARCC
jgi:hypothetical protein